MTEYVFDKPPQASVAVAESTRRLPVRRIFCVGRNYAAHAIEMGRDPDREPPFFFTKPADAVVDDRATIPYPPQTDDFQFEGELVVAIKKAGRNIAAKDSLAHVWGYAVGNDLTRRDVQSAAKKLGRPWDCGKGFDRSAVCGPVYPVSAVGHSRNGRITTRVNGVIRQDADIGDLIWPLPDVISILSHSIALAAGDLIYTGTPAGVGPLQVGDVCLVSIAGLGTLTTTIAAPE